MILLYKNRQNKNKDKFVPLQAIMTYVEREEIASLTINVGTRRK
jgi:hypothetical protein